MKEKDYLPPKCSVLLVEHFSCVCASNGQDITSSTEDFDVDLVEY
jgi:hypothetical protein